MKCVLIIPARYKSSRLPGKPLVDLNGIPMIIRTYKQCAKAFDNDLIFVATDDERIEKLCGDHDINFIRTPASCLTGTDRVASCIKTIKADVYINVQGDEPLFNPEDIKLIIQKSMKSPDSIISGFASITDENQYRSFNTPKVVMTPDNKLLFMSRSPIPTDKKGKFISSFRQVCAYAFPKKALEDFYKHKKKTFLEEIEDIEILRFLELGYEVEMIELSTDSVAVDTPDDVEKVRNLLNAIEN